MRHLSLALAAAAILALPVQIKAAESDSPSQQVRQALAEQDAWLSQQANGPGWNKFLHTAQLTQELGKEEHADGKIVRQVLAQYQASEYGLRLPQFVATRKALEVWADQLEQPKSSDLPARTRSAKENFQPVAKADLIERQTTAESAISRLDRYLSRPGNHGAEWRAHLGWDELQSQMKRGLDADPAVLRKLSDNFVNGDAGMELRSFGDVGRSLRSYADMLMAYQNKDAKAQYEKQIDSLASALDAAAAKPNDIDRHQLGATIDELSATGRSQVLVRNLRQRFGQPNLYARVSKDVVAGGIDDDIDEPTAINDVILGTQINGNGNTKGHVSALLLPSRDKARVELVLKGRTLAHTVGWNGPVTVFAHSTTSLLGRKQLTIDDTAFSGEPACAECCTNSCIDCLDICGGFIIQHIATKRVYSSKSTAEAISAQHAEERLEHRMDTRTGDLLSRVNTTFNEQFRNPLLRRGAFPQRLEFSTTSNALSVVGLQARSDELGANTAPPEAAADADLSLRLHESLVDNFTAVAMPGKTTRSLAYRRTMRDMMGDPYQTAEFNDLVQCLAETGAPADKRDPKLVITFEQFKSLMKDRLGLDVDEKEFATLTHDMDEGKLSREQYDKYLAKLPTENPVSYDDVLAVLQGQVQVDYSATTFADENPVSVKFDNGTARITMRLKSVTHRELPSRKWVDSPCPAEVSVAYRLELLGGKVTATRTENEVKQIGDKQLSSAQKELINKKLPERFFGKAGEQDRANQPIFPPTKTSNGLALRGRWKRLGEMPWSQLSAQDGWLALGWKVTGNRTAESDSPASLQASNWHSCRIAL